jgi:hypothetical protein
MKYISQLGYALLNIAFAAGKMGRTILPTAIVCGLIATGGLLRLYQIPAEDFVALQAAPDFDATLVFAQWRRARDGGADLALVGDSTCVNSLDGPRLSERLGKKVQPLCTMSFVGPRGYAKLLERFFAAASSDAGAIVVMHPGQFERHSAWEFWADPEVWADDQIRNASNRFQQPWGSLKILFRRGIYGRLIDTPILRETATAIVGGLSSYRRSILSTGTYYGVFPIQCFYCEPEEFLDQVFKNPSHALKNSSFPNVNELFVKSLEPMREVIERVGKQRVYLVIMPLANDQVTPEIEVKRNAVVKDIVDRIGLAPDHLLDTPVTVPTFFIPDGMHFHRPGSLWFSDRVAEAYEKPRLQETYQRIRTNVP